MRPFLLTLALALAALPAGAQQSAPQAIDPAWMRTDAAAKMVTFDLGAGLTNFNGSLNFNGFRDGELTLVVPAEWTVVVNFVNHDRALPHSAEVIRDTTRVPIRAIDPAIAGARTKDLEGGIPGGPAQETMRFVATPPGNYLFFCAVPGHGAAGMWIRLTIDPSATVPRMVLAPKPGR